MATLVIIEGEEGLFNWTLPMLFSDAEFEGIETVLLELNNSSDGHGELIGN